MDKAHQIGSEFADDGMVLENEHGPIQDRCQGEEVETIRPRGRGEYPIAYVFSDGSAIVLFDDCWDYRAPGCGNACPAEDKRCWCGEV